MKQDADWERKFGNGKRVSVAIIDCDILSKLDFPPVFLKPHTLRRLRDSNLKFGRETATTAPRITRNYQYIFCAVWEVRFNQSQELVEQALAGPCSIIGCTRLTYLPERKERLLSSL